MGTFSVASDSDCRPDGTSPLEKLAAAAGEARAAAANRPVDLNDAGFVWFVDRGALDLSMAEYAEDGLRSGFKHVLRLEPGRLAFGIDTTTIDTSLRLVAKGLPDTRVHRIPIRCLLEQVATGSDEDGVAVALVEQIDVPRTG